MKAAKITITLDRSVRNTSVYTNFDLLTGEISVVPSKKLAISSIKLSFEGYTKSTLPDDFNAPDISKAFSPSKNGTPIENPFLETSFSLLEHNLNTEAHELVSKNQVLSRHTTLEPKTAYTFPFSIMIPAEAKCCTESQHSGVFHLDAFSSKKIPLCSHNVGLYGENSVARFSLPPSTCASQESILRGLFGVAYYLKAVIALEKKPKSPIIEYKEVHFKPRDFSIDLWNREKRCSRILQYRSAGIFAREAQLLAHESKKKKYSARRQRCPASEFYLECHLYDSDYLTPGESPNCKLFLLSSQNPEEITSVNGTPLHNITIRNLEIGLLESTKIVNQSKLQKENAVLSDVFSKRVGVQGQSKSIDIPLKNAVEPTSRKALRGPGFVKIGNTYQYEIPMEFVVPESTVPSFKTCNIRREYKLSVRANLEGGSHQKPVSETLGLIEFKVKILSGVSSIIEQELIRENIRYTIQDVMDLAPKPESLPCYSEVMMVGT